MTAMIIIALVIWSIVGMTQWMCLIFQMALLAEQHRQVQAAKEKREYLQQQL